MVVYGHFGATKGTGENKGFCYQNSEPLIFQVFILCNNLMRLPWKRENRDKLVYMGNR